MNVIRECLYLWPDLVSGVLYSVTLCAAARLKSANINTITEQFPPGSLSERIKGVLGLNSLEYDHDDDSQYHLFQPSN